MRSPRTKCATAPGTNPASRRTHRTWKSWAPLTSPERASARTGSGPSPRTPRPIRSKKRCAASHRRRAPPPRSRSAWAASSSGSGGVTSRRLKRQLMRSTKLLRRKPGEVPATDRRSPFDARPFASRQKRGAGKVQRALDAMAEEADDVAYAEIRALAVEHNEKLLEKPEDVIPLLHRLDLIDRKAGTWLSGFEQAPSEGEAPIDFRKWTRMRRLREEVAEERTTLKTGLAVTPGAQVLAGPEAILEPGMTWSIDANKNGNWVDASELLTDPIAATIIDAEKIPSLLALTNKQEKYKGMADNLQLTLVIRFKAAREMEV